MAESRLVRMGDDDAAGDYAELAALFVGVIPVFGGAVSQVLNSWSAERRYQRIREVLTGLAQDFAQVKDHLHEDYVRSEEFADLLDQTLRRVATERSEEKRRLYRGVLFGAVTAAHESYDEQLHMLRVIDALQAAHIAVLRAILQAPPARDLDNVTGSFIGTLHERLPDLTEQRIDDLVAQLKDHHVINIGGLRTMMTARGAQDMRGTLTPFGKRLVSYLEHA